MKALNVLLKAFFENHDTDDDPDSTIVQGARSLGYPRSEIGKHYHFTKE